MSEVVAAAPEVTVTTAETPTAPPAVSKMQIALGISLVLILLVLYAFHKRIQTVQLRNTEIIKMLKDAELKHGLKKS